MSSAASANSTPTGESAGPLSPSLVPTDLNAVWTSTLGVDAVCEANGISREDFLQGKGADATLLELFLVVMPRCPPLQYFPNVTSLRLMHLSLERIEQVQHLPRLRQLWLSENNIARIDGLGSCPDLEELYLNANAIEKIQGLEQLPKLRVLWLQQNRISVVEGLGHLTELRSLSLAANRIRSVGSALSSLRKLEELNLSANELSGFRDIVPLCHLPALEKLWFSDALYGANSLCSLSNYQTFTLFTLRKLKQLDYHAVSMDQRTMAESTFLKKKIYYNMRIKTLKRNARAMFGKAEQYHTAKEGDSLLVRSMFARALFEIEAEMQQFVKAPASVTGFSDEKAVHSPTVPDKQHVADLRKKKAALQTALERREEEAIRMRELLRAVHRRITRHANNNIRRLILELQTGGNVRLEEGKPKDVWYQSCSELLRTRFFPTDFDAFGVRELRVNRVTKIFNRTVRSHFDGALEALVDTSDASYKRAIEYLFIVEPSNAGDDDLFSVVEFGSAAAGSSGKGPIAVTNSAFLVEHAKLQAALRRGDLLRPGASIENQALSGRVIVAKVFVGKNVPESPQFVPPSSDVPLGSEPLRSGDYPSDVTSVYRSKQGDSKQRVWFVRDSRLVLPEYVVEYNLHLSTSGDAPESAKAADVSELVSRAFPSASPVDAADLRGFAPHFLSYAQCVTDMLASTPSRDDATALLATTPDLAKRAVDLDDSGTLTVPELVRFLSKGSSDASDADREAFVQSLEQLHIVGSAFKQPAPQLATLLATRLSKLVLPFNDISDLGFLAPLTALSHVDLSHNVIRKLESLPADLDRLTTLKLAGNLVYKVEDARTLAETCAHLVHLTIAGNPVAESRAFVEAVLDGLDKLETMDHIDRPVAEERAMVRQRPMVLTSDVAHRVVSCGVANATQRRVDIQEAPLSHPDSFEPVPSDALFAEDSLSFDWREATSLVCRGQRLRDAPALREMTELLVLDLGFNQFTCFDCVLPRKETLEALTMDQNRLWRLDDLCDFKALRRLELARNHVSKLDGIRGLPHLSFLSLEDNAVTSIAPLATLPALAEVYLSGNRLTSQKEALHLRDLPRLIIVDFSGNPCCEEDMYRLYTVFQLKKLKVLDGVSIDATEQAQAKEVYAGRVSADLLNERVDPPGIEWSQVTELGLSSCGIKELTLLDQFVALQHLSLDRNLLSDVTGVMRCTSLVSLDLAFNKLSLSVGPIGRALCELPALESLSLESNGITSIAALQLSAPKLKFLNLKANDLSKVDGLDSLPNLRELVLDRNKLRALDANCFVQTPYLRQLSCEENSVKVLDGLRTLLYLQRVSFASNRIQEVPEVTRALEAARQLTEASFVANQVARKQMYRATIINCQPLLATLDGKDISPDERERAEGYFQQEAQMANIPPNVLTDVRPVLAPAQGVSGVAMQPRAGLRVMTLDDGAPQPPMAAPNPAGVGPARGRSGPAVSGGKAGPRTSSADISLRPRPKQSAVLPGVPRRRL